MEKPKARLLRKRVLPIAEPTRGEFKKVMEAGRLRKQLGQERKGLRAMISSQGLELTLQKLKLDAQGRRALNRMLTRKNPGLKERVHKALSKPGYFLPEVFTKINEEFAEKGVIIHNDGKLRFMTGMETEVQESLTREIETRRQQLTKDLVIEVFSGLGTKMMEKPQAFERSEMRTAIVTSKTLTDLVTKVNQVLDQLRR
ncbi:MAG: hypothetical protein Q7S92_05770 [Candidatus Diapherotrites archaeon]|nr:hypothetical protein [Candidatus Diapherotrites archaeon]